MTTQIEPAGLSVPEGAAYIGISPRMLWTLVWSGHVPHRRFGRRVIIPRHALDALLDGRRTDLRANDS